MSDQPLSDARSGDSATRRSFLNTAKGAALVAPAVTLLLTASTQMALPYGGNPGNNKDVGNSGDKFGGDGTRGNSP